VSGNNSRNDSPSAVSREHSPSAVPRKHPLSAVSGRRRRSSASVGLAPRAHAVCLSTLALTLCLASLTLCLASLALCLAPRVRAASEASPGIVCRHELRDARRREVAARLREITGRGGLQFDDGGVLRFGEGVARFGSQTARELLSKAARGGKLIVLEDASDRAEVVFSRVVPGRWTRGEEGRPPAFVVQIDFADFERVRGDREALASFNVGWAVMHEVSHVVNDSVDAERPGDVGECEELVNRMRRECGLAERAEYHYRLLPGVEREEFKTRYVRLAFERQDASTSKKRRLWLIWDADAGGGLDLEK
jgi:hypothetical protein